MPQRKRRTTPTYKQKMFARAYVKNAGNGTKAALEAYDGNYNDAKSIATQNLHKEVVQEEIKRVEQTLLNKGMSLEWLAEKSKETIINGMGVKASQKEANDMIKFMYKLYNALPATKSMKMSVNFKAKLPPQNVSEAIEAVKSLSVKSTELIKDLTS